MMRQPPSIETEDNQRGANWARRVRDAPTGICPGAVLRVVSMVAATCGSGGVAERASAVTGMLKRKAKTSRLE
jgi:hypothetical protein